MAKVKLFGSKYVFIKPTCLPLGWRLASNICSVCVNQKN